MITIEIGNSYSKILGLNAKQEKELRSTLSYVVGGSSAYFSGYGIRKKSLLDKKGGFPTGLRRRVMDYLRVNNLEHIAKDTRIKPELAKPLEIGSKIKPYEWQSKAALTAHQLSRGTISACTGTGKSLVIALIAAKLNVRTLIIVPSLEIKKQLTESVKHVLGNRHKCVIENIDSRKLLTMKDFDCLIIDEAHHSAAKTYQKLNKIAWKDIYYRFFLTATPFRNDTEETLLFEAIAGRVIYKLDYKEAVAKNYIVPVEAFYIELNKKKTDAYTWQEVYKELIVNNKDRNDLISKLLFSLHASRISSLCLVKEVKHGHNISVPGYSNFVHGEDEESRKLIAKFNTQEITCLIGTEGILSEGVDTKPCQYVILAGLGRAKSRTMQAIGRALRIYPGKESAKIIIFKDKSHKFLLRHFNSQCKVLKEEYGVIPIKLELK